MLLWNCGTNCCVEHPLGLKNYAVPDVIPRDADVDFQMDYFQKAFQDLGEQPRLGLTLEASGFCIPSRDN